MTVRACVFDLDDTLYLERDYVRSGFQAAGAWLVAEHGIPGLAEVAWRRFEEGCRQTVFDEALRELGHAPEPVLIRQLVEVYRTHAPALTLQPDAAWVLDRLAAMGLPVGLLTDGPLVSQERKVAALGLASRLAALVYTDRYGRAGWKPCRRGFRELERELGVSGRACVYVGDNPAKDFIAPRQLGWLTVRLRRMQGEHARVAAAPGTDAHHTIETLEALPQVALADA
jgi:putative hydrolase of the HAD superfamily